VIVTIDGPAGSGKSTTARRVARRLGYVYLDTGAMYRAVAYGFLSAGADPTPDAAQEHLPKINVDLKLADDSSSEEDADESGPEMRVFLNKEDVTQRIRTSQVGDMASRIAQLRPVREKMVREQRRVGRQRDQADGGVVLDGRDTGTIVFPNADVKIFMVADPRERARRRQAEYRNEGKDVPLDDVQREIEDRDRQDRERDIAPLVQADDAIELDTTDRTIPEQVDFVVERVEERRRQGT